MLLLGPVLITSGCYPGSSDLATEDFDVVATLYNDQTNFGSIRTYAMPDTVMHITCDPNEDDRCDPDDEDISREHDTVILQTVAQKMNGLNYTRIPVEDITPENVPDVVITVQATTTTWTGYVSYPWWGYWGYYPGWPGWGPGWGPGYPVCCATGVYQYTTGSLLLEMLDIREANEGLQEVPAPWTAGINGLLSSSSQSNRSRIVSTINQAFDQSPYLGAK